MSITFELNGAVTLRDDADPSRVAVIPAGAGDRDAQIAAFFGPAPPPDGPTLSDWRVAVDLWGRLDDVTARVAALVASSDSAQVRLGKIARQRLEFANNVYRDQLLALKDAAGFTAADIDESLWRAARIALGDLSGVWPLPGAA